MNALIYHFYGGSYIMGLFYTPYVRGICNCLGCLYAWWLDHGHIIIIILSVLLGEQK